MQEPYCGKCGYTLTGLTESSKCPECGSPLVEVLRRRGEAFQYSKRYTSDIRLFGLPLVQIATGPDASGPRGKAKAIIAIGDQAYGLLAIGGMAVGVVAIGGMALGIFALGGMALGLLVIGGWAVGGLALGGGAIGLLAFGGGAVGLVAVGGGAIGYIAAGGGVYGKYITAPYRKDPEAAQFFTDHAWFFGDGSIRQLYMSVGIWILLVVLVLLVAIGALAAYAYFRHGEPET